MLLNNVVCVITFKGQKGKIFTQNSIGRIDNKFHENDFAKDRPF
jgi:hypothetical protein